MTLSLSALKAHLDTTASVGEIVDALIRLGVPGAAAIDPAAGLQSFTVALIVGAAPHPNADKLQVCQVDTKDGRLEIVCGALNARAGLKTAFAPSGAYVPGTGITLEPKPVRGVVSHGMLCSEVELQVRDDPFGLRAARFSAYQARAEKLGLSEAKARADGGILELPDDAALGAAVAALLGMGDPLIMASPPAHRPDWASAAGLARELAAAGLGTLKADADDVKDWRAAIAFEPDSVYAATGMEIAPQRCRAILLALGFAVDDAAPVWTVRPPGFRADVGSAGDLISEMIRIEGLGGLPMGVLATAESRAPLPPAESRERAGRMALCALGYDEAITPSDCALVEGGLFGGANGLRACLLPNLLRAGFKGRTKTRQDVALFEIGAVFDANGAASRMLGAVRVLPHDRTTLLDAGVVYAVQQDCIAALEAMGVPIAALQISRASAPHWHPWRAGVFKLGPKVIAAFGQVQAAACGDLSIDVYALAFEIYLDAIAPAKAKRARPPMVANMFAPLTKAFVFQIDETILAGDVMRAIVNANRTWIKDAEITWMQIGPQQTITVEVQLAAKDRPLTEAEVETVSAQIIAAAGKAGAPVGA
jgi:phenylalanyl-tRNA synthetase beta subunit/tRNA-binding EMAP/Myf-like protein